MSEPTPKLDELRFDLGSASDGKTAGARLRLTAVDSNRIAAHVAAASTPSLDHGPHVQGYGVAATEQGHVVEYLRILHKRRWTAATAFVVVFGLTAIYTFVATPIYTARVQLLIENENPNVVKFEEVVDQNKSTNDYYQTQYRILQSRALARRTIESAKLWQHAVLVSDPTMAEHAREWLGRSDIESANAAPGAEESAEQSRLIDAFLKRLTVTPVRNSRLVDIGFSSADPLVSSQIANALARQYIEQNLEFKLLATKEATDFLNERTAEQRQALEQSEQALQKYREQTGAVALEDRQNIVIQRLADVNAAVTKARTERIEKQSLYNQIRSIQGDRAAVDTFPAILNSAFIQQLKAQQNELQRQRSQLAEKLGARHPEMVKVQSAIETTETRIASEIQKVVQALRNDYQAALANEKSLQASLDHQRAEAQELNRAAIQYNVLQRDAVSNQTMFTGLLERSRETGISGELKTSNIRIVDTAEVPRRPTSPDKLTNLSVGLFGGVMLGLILAFFFEYLDNRIRQPDELKQHLGIPYLGMIPAFAAKDAVGPPLIGGGMPVAFAEAFRSIRTNVLFSSAEEGLRSVLVTSTGPGEGKSVVSANLALSLSMAGQRVLLIDADMRRPKAHELFGISLEPGLSNLMVGNAKASQSVRKTRRPNLWILPAGKHPPNPAELLGSRRFREFIGSLRDQFDYVIIDSPPIMAVTDASVIAHIASGVVFVVGCEMTAKGAAKAALEQLDAAKANYLGAILNRVEVGRNSHYYSRYYRKEYQAYYTKSAS